jgi:hypothetical protein
MKRDRDRQTETKRERERQSETIGERKHCTIIFFTDEEREREGDTDRKQREREVERRQRNRGRERGRERALYYLQINTIYQYYIFTVYLFFTDGDHPQYTTSWECVKSGRRRIQFLA